MKQNNIIFQPIRAVNEDGIQLYQIQVAQQQYLNLFLMMSSLVTIVPSMFSIAHFIFVFSSKLSLVVVSMRLKLTACFHVCKQLRFVYQSMNSLGFRRGSSFSLQQSVLIYLYLTYFMNAANDMFYDRILFEKEAQLKQFVIFLSCLTKMYPQSFLQLQKGWISRELAFMTNLKLFKMCRAISDTAFGILSPFLANLILLSAKYCLKCCQFTSKTFKLVLYLIFLMVTVSQESGVSSVSTFCFRIAISKATSIAVLSIQQILLLIFNLQPYCS